MTGCGYDFTVYETTKNGILQHYEIWISIIIGSIWWPLKSEMCWGVFWLRIPIMGYHSIGVCVCVC